MEKDRETNRQKQCQRAQETKNNVQRKAQQNKEMQGVFKKLTQKMYIMKKLMHDFKILCQNKLIF